MNVTMKNRLTGAVYFGLIGLPLGIIVASFVLILAFAVSINYRNMVLVVFLFFSWLCVYLCFGFSLTVFIGLVVAAFYDKYNSWRACFIVGMIGYITATCMFFKADFDLYISFYKQLMMAAMHALPALFVGILVARAMRQPHPNKQPHVPQ